MNHHRTDTANLELSMLPDEILVCIGTSVAKLCGIRDFLFLSLACKRMKRLLMDSKETVSNVIRIRTSRIDHSSMLLPSSCSSPLSKAPPLAMIRNLEQLAFYESVVANNLLEENRVHFDFADLQIVDRNSIALIQVVQRILNRHPSASVLLEAHCGTPAPTEIAWMYSHYRGKVVRRAMIRNHDKDEQHPESSSKRKRDKDRYGERDDGETKKDLELLLLQDRIRIRAWGKMVAEIVCQSQHPYREIARQGRGWVEIFLNMEVPETGKILEFPPRPDFYNKVLTTPRVYTIPGSR